jgi:hypothetical protein
MRAAAIAMLAISSAAYPQGSSTRPATAQEFIGYWRVINISNDKHGSPIKNEQTGYSNPCQFLIHSADGVWKNITISNLHGDAPRDCPTTRAAIDVALLGTQPQQKWVARPNQSGLFMVLDEKAKDAQFWKVDYVDSDLQTTERFGLDMKRGDLIVQLLKNLGGNNLAPIWPMILRPVSP